MIINIASFGGRSHLLDLARELEKKGNKVRFYSYVPDKRATKFGLKNENNNSLYFYAFPFLCLFKIFGQTRFLLYCYRVVFDFIVSIIMEPCDVYIGQVPMHYHSLKMAKKKYGAVTVCESGLSNIDEYIRILQSIGSTNYPKLGINRYRKCYDEADYIAVASIFTEKGFLNMGYKQSKLFMNPYGVELNNFHPTELEQPNFDCIVIGQWSKRKGSDMVAEICKKNRYTLLHVGTIVDINFPHEKNFTHIEPVQEYKLIEYYSKAKVFLFPSYEDGFGLVLLQAAACGLPIVCSPNTGGPTLKSFIADKKWIIEMDSITPSSLELCIKKGLKLSKEQIGVRNYISNDLNKLSWESYGERYNNFLHKIAQRK